MRHITLLFTLLLAVLMTTGCSKSEEDYTEQIARPLQGVYTWNVTVHYIEEPTLYIFYPNAIIVTQKDNYVGELTMTDSELTISNARKFVVLSESSTYNVNARYIDQDNRYTVTYPWKKTDEGISIKIDGALHNLRRVCTDAYVSFSYI